MLPNSTSPAIMLLYIYRSSFLLCREDRWWLHTVIVINDISHSALLSIWSILKPSPNERSHKNHRVTRQVCWIIESHICMSKALPPSPSPHRTQVTCHELRNSSPQHVSLIQRLFFMLPGFFSREKVRLNSTIKHSIVQYASGTVGCLVTILFWRRGRLCWNRPLY